MMAAQRRFTSLTTSSTWSPPKWTLKGGYPNYISRVIIPVISSYEVQRASKYDKSFINSRSEVIYGGHVSRSQRARQPLYNRGRWFVYKHRKLNCYGAEYGETEHYSWRSAGPQYSKASLPNWSCHKLCLEKPSRLCKLVYPEHGASSEKDGLLRNLIQVTIVMGQLRPRWRIKGAASVASYFVVMCVSRIVRSLATAMPEVLRKVSQNGATSHLQSCDASRLCDSKFR